MKPRLVASIALVSLGAVAAVVALAFARAPRDSAPKASLAALGQSYIAVERGLPVSVPPLVSARGTPITRDLFLGSWSLVFLGFTTCPDVCPTALSVLSVVARDSTSGVATGATKLVFISVDPETDTPDVMMGYLKNFDRRIVGVTGQRASVDSVTAAIGASYERLAGGIDHSTSIFVIDPQGRVAGILLRPSNPAKIVADLNALRGSEPAAMRVSHAR